MSRSKPVLVISLFIVITILTFGYSNCGHAPEVTEISKPASVATQGDRLVASYSKDAAVDFRANSSKKKDFDFDQVEQEPKEELAPLGSREIYPPQAFTLKVNGSEVTNRSIREYMLSLSTMPARQVASAQHGQMDAISISITPRDVFPSPLNSCAKFIMVIDENAQRNVASSQSALSAKYVKVRDSLSQVREIHVRGQIEKFRQPSGSIFCRTAQRTVVKLQSPKISQDQNL